MRIAHSRLYYEITLERTTDPNKAEECRAALAQLDGIKPERRAAEVRPGVNAPVLDGSWLEQWLERALPWASVHANVTRMGYWRVRLLVGAPLEDLASETRLRITVSKRGNDVHVVFPTKAHREFAIRYIDARKQRVAAPCGLDHDGPCNVACGY